MWQKYKPNELSKSPESKLKDIYTQKYKNQTALKKKKKNPKDMDKEKKILKVTTVKQPIILKEKLP